MSKKDYIQIATELVEQAGGTVVGRVVEKVGVSLLYDYGLTSEGESIIQYFAQKRGLQEKGHLGVYEMREVAVLVAGCSLECVLELVSNRLNRSCRLTSSKTNAAIETLYANTVDAVWVEQFLKLRKSYLESTHKTLEEKNQFNLSAKCGYVVISMGMRDWYFLLKSRLVDKGLEQEVRTVLVQIEKQLKKSKNWVF
jgi:hypothetical protein